MSNPFDLPPLPPTPTPELNPDNITGSMPLKDTRPDELAILKQQADIMGIAYSNNIGVDTLRAKIRAKMDEPEKPPAKRPVVEEAEDQLASDDEIMEKLPASTTPLSKQEKMRLQKLEYLRLVRLRITNLNPAKASLKGEVITVANSLLGKVSKYVPYGDECGEDGYHVPYIIFLAMKEKKFSQVKTDKRHIPRASDVHEFALEELKPLTQKQLQSLAVKQAAATGTTESQSSDE